MIFCIPYGPLLWSFFFVFSKTGCKIFFGCYLFLVWQLNTIRLPGQIEAGFFSPENDVSVQNKTGFPWSPDWKCKWRFLRKRCKNRFSFKPLSADKWLHKTLNNSKQSQLIRCNKTIFFHRIRDLNQSNHNLHHHNHQFLRINHNFTYSNHKIPRNSTCVIFVKLFDQQVVNK